MTAEKQTLPATVQAATYDAGDYSIKSRRMAMTGLMSVVGLALLVAARTPLTMEVVRAGYEMARDIGPGFSEGIHSIAGLAFLALFVWIALKVIVKLAQRILMIRQREDGMPWTKLDETLPAYMEFLTRPDGSGYFDFKDGMYAGAAFIVVVAGAAIGLNIG
ncbi:hypothetical protein [Mesorhizobium sp. CAU 1741]|uniref:hypothetical protein n=1 Tax=Mesorhizobium sp. CAU 1741 TaxID=3140366 RepID=UPI00325AFFAF